MTEKINITAEAIKEIKRILSNGNDVLIKYRKNKNAIDIIEQKNSTCGRFSIEIK